ncbi:MAG: hypothetical protein CL676_08835 [Bdellovibrionaceae bacterium]|nr:hypothetical protein [Pseudobdellovibrionaceae bacterium]|tara:strand:- start:2814 stop:3218 length:405 start_codon:yes stop_codon:yes gene_type:complete
MGAERRIADRKLVDPVRVAELTSLSSYNVIASEGIIIDASQSGFLLKVDRLDLIPEDYKKNLNLNELIGDQVVMFLPQMNLDLDGTVTRALHTGRGCFEIAVTFSQDIPEYWRDCLVDLLPYPGEFENPSQFDD